MHCPSRAKVALTDELADLRNYQYNIALPAPALYTQFNTGISVDAILTGLIRLGFDNVFEVAEGAEIVTLACKDYLKRREIARPVISSACPAVVRLIQVKFPELIGYLAPFDAPVEVAARIARTEAARLLGLEEDKIGVWFLTPCPAKMSVIKQPLGSEKSNITGAIAINKIYNDLLKAIAKDRQSVMSRASWLGVGWALSGGETTAIGTDKTLVVNSIHNVIDILEQIALGKLADVDFIEVLACAGGCIGGPLTVENRHVAEFNMKERLHKKQSANYIANRLPRQTYTEFQIGMDRKAIEPKPALRLDEDIDKAMSKIEMMDQIMKRLPGLDCGSCGSPNCKALAEDIAQGGASETDCVFILRQRTRDLALAMVDLAVKLPPSLARSDDSDDDS